MLTPFGHALSQLFNDEPTHPCLHAVMLSSRENLEKVTGHLDAIFPVSMIAFEFAFKTTLRQDVYNWNFNATIYSEKMKEERSKTKYDYYKSLRNDAQYQANALSYVEHDINMQAKWYEWDKLDVMHGPATMKIRAGTDRVFCTEPYQFLAGFETHYPDNRQKKCLVSVLGKALNCLPMQAMYHSQTGLVDTFPKEAGALRIYYHFARNNFPFDVNSYAELAMLKADRVPQSVVRAVASHIESTYTEMVTPIANLSVAMVEEALIALGLRKHTPNSLEIWCRLTNTYYPHPPVPRTTFSQDINTPYKLGALIPLFFQCLSSFEENQPKWHWDPMGTFKIYDEVKLLNGPDDEKFQRKYTNYRLVPSKLQLAVVDRKRKAPPKDGINDPVLNPFVPIKQDQMFPQLRPHVYQSNGKYRRISSQAVWYGEQHDQ